MKKLEWSNPKGIDLSAPLLYCIFLTTHDGKEYRYVGKASAREGKKRLNRYAGNVNAIYDNKKPLSGSDKFRAVHLALYQALENDWEITFYPFKNCLEAELNSLEKQYRDEFKSNLNWHSNRKARGWTLKELENGLPIEDLVPDILTTPLEELGTP